LKQGGADGQNQGKGSIPLGEEGQLSSEPWPSEGRTLREILEPVLSPAEWSELAEHTGELQPRFLNNMGKWAIIPVYPSSSPQYGELAAEIRLFLEMWNSGQLIAKGRRGDLLTTPVDIPPPSVGYDIEVADFTRSVIRDPTNPEKKIYDLRFFVANTEPKFEIATKATSKFVTEEARRMKAAGEIDKKIKITAFAKELANRMKVAHNRGDQSIKPVGYLYIKNMLRQWGLWPIEAIK
jgi:hypothetical protein